MGGIEFLWAGVASAAEMGIFWAAALVLWRRFGLTIAESGAYAVICVFMAFSFLFQVAFLIRLPLVSLAVESLGVVWAIRVIGKNKDVLVHVWSSLRENARNQWVAGAVLGGACLYLGLQAFIGTGNASSWPGGFPVDIGATLPGVWGPLRGAAPANVQVLPYLFFRWQSGLGAGWIGFWAYLCIGFSTYALARRYAWSPTAACVTLMVLSFPRFVHHAVSPGMEIVSAAFAAFCILAMYRLVEQLKVPDLVLLVWAVSFQISARPMGLVFPIILAALAFKVSYHRHGMFSWRPLVSKNRLAAALSLFPVVLFSQVWRFFDPAGAENPGTTPLDAAYNEAGIYGAGVNLFRYLLQAVTLPEPVDRLVAVVAGCGWNPFLIRIHDAVMEMVSIDTIGQIPFDLPSAADGATAGFGPFGVLLLWPGLFWAVFRGPRRLKAVSVALLVYVYTVVLILAWRPENGSYFNVFYAAGGFCMAFLLPPWRLTAKGRVTLQVLSALILAYTCWQL